MSQEQPNERAWHRANHAWHVAVNAHSQAAGHEEMGWMYEAKRGAEEADRLHLLFTKERTGSLRQMHKQCSQQDPVPVEDNHLTCALGIECRKCPHLLALDTMEAAPEHIDRAKAWTCIGHILQKGNGCDTSEGYILTADDRMYWDNVYQSLAAGDEALQREDEEREAIHGAKDECACGHDRFDHDENGTGRCSREWMEVGDSDVGLVECLCEEFRKVAEVDDDDGE